MRRLGVVFEREIDLAELRNKVFRHLSTTSGGNNHVY